MPNTPIVIQESIFRLKEDVGTGDQFFHHVQSTASTVWNVAHNLNKYPVVTVSDENGNKVEVDYQYIDTNNVRITSVFPTKGNADFS